LDANGGSPPLRDYNESALERPTYSRQKQDDIIRVRPYQKKYVNDIPGSCPVESRRTNEENLNYEHRYGKGPLLERAERLKKL
jgi:hypothetical protein